MPRARLRTGALSAGALTLALAAALFAVSAVARLDTGLITSDESLYLAEAVSIAQGRIEYPSGDAIVHRPPLFPATLAPMLRLTGNDIDAARIVPLLYAAGALAALYALARALYDARIAAATALLAAVAVYPAKLAGAFFLDTAATVWLLASAAALMHGARSGRDARWHALAGALLGLAFLTKESSAAWLPLPLLLMLLGATPMRLRPLAAFAATFGVFALPWIAWVAFHTGVAFKLDRTDPGLLAGAAVGTGAIAAVAAVIALSRRGSSVAAAATGALVLAGWCVGLLYVMESRPEPHAVDYLGTVPEWTVRVFGSNVEPFWLIAAAWAYLPWRAARDGGRSLPLLLIAALAAPMYIYAANRGWEPRQVMPLVYLSYLALAVAAADMAAAVARQWHAIREPHAWLAAIVVLAFFAGLARDVTGRAAAPIDDPTLDWRNAHVAQLASWIDAEVPDGAVVLSSRLYYSQLYVETDGRVHIRQLPTVGVTLDQNAGEVRPFGTLFRYEDAAFDAGAPRTWLYVRPYPGRDYAVALAEEDLLDAIARDDAQYILLSGEDAAFSSLSYAGYFIDRPAYRLIRSGERDGVRSMLFRIDRDRLSR